MLAGRLTYTVMTGEQAKPLVDAGKLRALATAGTKRALAFPDIPTLAEATGEEYPPPWFGMFAPAGTPAPILDKVHAELMRIMGGPGFKQKNFIERAVDPVPQTRAEFARFIAGNRAFAARVARETGIQPQ